jgi:hypothetical protein
MVLGKIDPDIEILNNLHEIYPWVPSGGQIRPNESTLEQKCKDMETNSYNIDELYNKLFKNHEICRFLKNKYPYNVSDQTHHYVLWFPFRENYLDDQQIILNINKEIKMIVGNDEFDFCWYENPNMTISEIYHVQVFWTELLIKSQVFKHK